MFWLTDGLMLTPAWELFLLVMPMVVLRLAGASVVSWLRDREQRDPSIR